jgi:hypothetical protein
MSKLEWEEEDDRFGPVANLVDGGSYQIFGAYSSDGYRACYFPPIVTMNLVRLGIARTVENAKALCEAYFANGRPQC